MVQNATTAGEVEETIQWALKAIKAKSSLDSISHDLEFIVASGFPEGQAIASILPSLKTTRDIKGIVALADTLKYLANKAITYSYAADLVKNPSLVSSLDWNVNRGNYTGGEQKASYQAGKDCWSALWNIPASDKNSTMAIEQQIIEQKHGFYALECLAGTEHLCESDQHGYIIVKDEKLQTPNLSLGCLDLPSINLSQRWNMLVTPYIYVSDDDTITIGFESSKQNAVDSAWMKYGTPDSKGDNREGSWYATDFKLRRIGAFQQTVDRSGWGTICLPFKIQPTEGITLYQVVGMLNGSYICIEPLEGETVAGTPYLFHCNPESTATFFESGEEATSAKNKNGLRGSLFSLSKSAVGALTLINGIWVRSTEDNRPRVPIYSAYIKDPTTVPTLESFDGMIMKIGTMEDDLTEVISEIKSSTSFNLNGQYIPSNSKGLMIQSKKIIFLK